MKQTYVKPSVVVERFSLTQNIASTCGAYDNEWGQCNHWNKETCGWQTPYGSVIWLDYPICDDHYGPNDDFNGICYNNPGNGLTIFGS